MAEDGQVVEGGDLDAAMDATMDAAMEEVAVQEGGESSAPLSAPSLRSAPKAWAKEFHDAYGKLDPKLQDYIDLREKQAYEGIASYAQEARYAKELRDAFAPFDADIRAMGATPTQAVTALMQAHQMLSKGSPEERVKLFQRLARDYQVDLGTLSGGAPSIPPEIADLRQQVQGIVGHLTAEHQAQAQARQSSAMKEAETFFADPAHPYAAEVADHIVLLLQNPELSLQDAYEQAVWANPATRAKEQARLQKEAEEASRKKAEEEAERARRSRGTVIRGKPSQGGPSSPLGTMEDTLRETFTSIQRRV